ncbi:hypothetical protein QBC39DRAFT_397005 [Podospora conica]|nr:hypothetical protein QBC39DRAFT_397005 [Schizothecium conicum]
MPSNYYTRFAPSGSIVHLGDATEPAPPTVPPKEKTHHRPRINPVLESPDKQPPLITPRIPPSINLYRRSHIPNDPRNPKPIPVFKRVIGEDKDGQHVIYHEFHIGKNNKRSRGNCVGFSPGRIDIYTSDVHSPLIAHISTSFSMLCLGVFGRLPEELPVGLPSYKPASSSISLPGKYGGAPRCYKLPDMLGNFGFTIGVPRIETRPAANGRKPSYVLVERMVRFAWRRCGHDELEMLGDKGHKKGARLDGMKLVRDADEEIRIVDNPKDVVAIYRPNDMYSDELGGFHFLGTGAAGAYGTDWAILAVASGLVALSWDGELRAVMR